MKNALSPNQEEIAVRAYHLFLDGGCQHGRDVEYWLQAEKELGVKFFTAPTGHTKGNGAALVAAPAPTIQAAPAPTKKVTKKAAAPAAEKPAAEKPAAKKAPAKKAAAKKKKASD